MEYATERINRSAGDVVKAFLDFGRDKMKRLDEDESRMSKSILPSQTIPTHTPFDM